VIDGASPLTGLGLGIAEWERVRIPLVLGWLHRHPTNTGAVAQASTKKTAEAPGAMSQANTKNSAVAQANHKKTAEELRQIRISRITLSQRTQ